MDTSIERLEFAASAEFAARHRIFANGRELRLSPLHATTAGRAGAGDHEHLCGLRYRRTALYPSLHPGIKPHLPLELTVTTDDPGKAVACFRLEENIQQFRAVGVAEAAHPPDKNRPAAKSDPALLAYDLRLE